MYNKKTNIQIFLREVDPIAIAMRSTERFQRFKAAAYVYRRTFTKLSQLLRPELRYIASIKAEESSQISSEAAFLAKNNVDIRSDLFLHTETWRLWEVHGKKASNPVYTQKNQIERQIREKLEYLMECLGRNALLTDEEIVYLVDWILKQKQDESSGGSHRKIKTERLFPSPFVTYTPKEYEIFLKHLNEIVNSSEILLFNEYLMKIKGSIKSKILSLKMKIEIAGMDILNIFVKSNIKYDQLSPELLLSVLTAV
jgi:hypothetical protein